MPSKKKKNRAQTIWMVVCSEAQTYEEWVSYWLQGVY